MYNKGQILWFDKRDLEGVIVDQFGAEHYFNASCLDKDTDAAALKDGMPVKFAVNAMISHCPVACWVHVDHRALVKESA